jgi:hypothetical protein
MLWAGFYELQVNGASLNEYHKETQLELKPNSLAWVIERTIPTERPPLVSEVSAITKGLQLDLKPNSLAWVIERTVPTERPPLVSEVSANFCG